MFIIDIVLRNSPATLSIQRKTAEDAQSSYQQVITAMNSGTPKILELSCDQQVGKKIAVTSSDISAVQFAEKSSTATASGRPPGFFAIAE